MSLNAMKHGIPILKRVIPSLKKRLARLRAKDGWFEARSDGAHFHLNADNFVDRQIAFYDDFELEQRAKLFGAMAETGCDLFLDVGANIGYYSVLAAAKGLATKVMAFEPDARNLDQFRRNIDLNGVGDRVEVVPKAVAGSSGTARFLPGPAGSTGQSKLTAEVGERTQAVDCVALDDAVQVRGQRVFVKIDIEGGELAAVDGMAGLIKGNRVYLQIECYRDRIPLLTARLGEMGCRPDGQIEHDLYFRND